MSQLRNEKWCPKCNHTKCLSEFYKCSKSKDGLQYWCKSHSKKYGEKYIKTVTGLIANIYKGQKSRSKRRKFPLPAYSRKELEDWILSQPNFKKLYENWVNSGYDKNLKPSCDRLNNDLPYFFNNIQLVTWQENRANANRDRRRGLLFSITPLKPVVGVNIKTSGHVEFISEMEAERKLNIKRSGISKCCHNKRKTAGGYTWNFK